MKVDAGGKGFILEDKESEIVKNCLSKGIGIRFKIDSDYYVLNEILFEDCENGFYLTLRCVSDADRLS